MGKILIVDDSEAARVQLYNDLNTAGYEILQARDGVHGLEVLQENKGADIRLLICDLNMPNMDGISMCGRIREFPEFKTLPIFMLTTETDVEKKAKGKAVGITAWVTKPYAKDKLLFAVEKVLSRKL